MDEVLRQAGNTADTNDTKSEIQSGAEMSAGTGTDPGASPTPEQLAEAVRLFGRGAYLYRPKRGRNKGRYCLGYPVSAAGGSGFYYQRRLTMSWKTIANDESWAALMACARTECLLRQMEKRMG